MGGVRAGANMSVMLSLLGILVAATGIAAIGFGIPINEFTLGTTLIVAGVSALTGGLVLIGLAAVVAELGRLGETVRTRMVARPARPGEASELVQPPAPALAGSPAPVVGVRSTQPASPRLRSEPADARSPESQPVAGSSALEAAGERSHSNIPRAERGEPSIVADNDEVPLSPNGAAHVLTPRPRSVEAASPEVSAEDHVGGAAVEALRASRLDFLFRSKPPRPASQRENFDAVWPADARPARTTEAGPSPAAEVKHRQADHAEPAQDRGPELVSPEEPRGAAAILKSGVVDGMAYTLYADGSIEAKLPHGTVRFGSIAELRAHIETNS
jgi:hypothetical protein